MQETKMARPKPNIILAHVDKKTHRKEEILEAKAIFAVFYKDSPINIKSSHSLMNFPSPKYKKSSFSNSGHAFNLADKLNEMFHCADFTVHKLIAGEQVHE